jgi:hypothetical protein
VILLNILGALSLIQYCLTPDANHRATTKDMLRHNWLANGPVLSLRLNSNASSSLSLADQQSHADYDKAQARTSTTPTSAKTTEKSTSPTNSLVELEMHTSSFFDTARLREHKPSTNREQQRRHRASAVADTARYYSSNNSKANSSIPSRPAQRRPLSLSLENQNITSPTDYHFASTSEAATSGIPSVSQVYPRRARRTVSPGSNKTNSTYGNHDRLTSPPSSYRYALNASPESARKTVSPTSPPRYLVSYDFDPTVTDLKRKPAYKYTPSPALTTSEFNVVPSLSNSTTPVGPSVFTTSAIKFAPAPNRLKSPLRDHETTSNVPPTSAARLFNATLTNPSSHFDDTKLNTASSTNRRSLLGSVDLTTPATNIRKSRLLDDNNNFISLKVHD